MNARDLHSRYQQLIAALEKENAELKNELLPLRIDYVVLKREFSELRKAATKYLNCAIPCMITVYLDDSEHRMLRSAERALRAMLGKID